MKLYEITAQYRHALTFLNEADLSSLSLDEQQQLIHDTLDQFTDQFQSKALAIGAFIANLELEADALKTMEQRIQQRRKANERKAEWLRDYVHVNMQAMAIDEIKDQQIQLSIRKNPPKVIIDDEAALPEVFKATQVSIIVRKSQIAEALKAGDWVPGAHWHTIPVYRFVRRRK